MPFLSFGIYKGSLVRIYAHIWELSWVGVRRNRVTKRFISTREACAIGACVMTGMPPPAALLPIEDASFGTSARNFDRGKI